MLCFTLLTICRRLGGNGECNLFTLFLALSGTKWLFFFPLDYLRSSSYYSITQVNLHEDKWHEVIYIVSISKPVVPQRYIKKTLQFSTDLFENLSLGGLFYSNLSSTCLCKILFGLIHKIRKSILNWNACIVMSKYLFYIHKQINIWLLLITQVQEALTNSVCIEIPSLNNSHQHSYWLQILYFQRMQRIN